MSATMTYVNFVDNRLEIDVNTETILKIRLDGDIVTRTDDNNIEYTTDSGLRLIVNMNNDEFEIYSDSIELKLTYVDFPEMPEFLAEAINKYMANK